LAFSKKLSPLTTDPAAGAEAVSGLAPAEAVVAGVPPVKGVVGLVLEHPAMQQQSQQI